MNDERLNRHITHENLALRSENSQLKTQMGTMNDMYNNSQDEVLRLLNQIASDMVKRSDVDEIVKNAVSEEHDRMVAFYEEKMKAMAAEYEAKIAALEKKNGKGGNKGGKGNSGTRKKPNTETYATKEEAIAALEEAQKKALAMADQAFGGGSEKLTAERKPAVNPQEENADDDSNYVDETVGDVFVIGDDGSRHLRTRYFWGIRSSVTKLVYFIYDKGSRSRKVITDFLTEFKCIRKQRDTGVWLTPHEGNPLCTGRVARTCALYYRWSLSS